MRYQHVLDELPLRDAYTLLHALLASKGVRVITPAARNAALLAAELRIQKATTAKNSGEKIQPELT